MPEEGFRCNISAGMRKEAGAMQPPLGRPSCGEPDEPFPSDSGRSAVVQKAPNRRLHSFAERSTSDGSTRLARKAGFQTATKPRPMMTKTPEVKVKGS